jgi:phage tail P2-like protein
MSKDIYNVRWFDVIPPTISGDKQVLAISAAVSPQLQDVSQNIQECILLPRLDELPEAVVDLLAWQYHVDFYESDLPLERKRNLVRSSIEAHRHKGTPYAVERVVAAAFGNVKLSEWFEYDGEPYHFKIDVNLEEESTDKNRWKKVIAAINSAKNTRSWLDKISYYYPDIILPVIIRHIAASLQNIDAHHVFWNLGTLRYTMRNGEFMRDGTIRYGGIYPDENYRDSQPHEAELSLNVRAYHIQVYDFVATDQMSVNSTAHVSVEQLSNLQAAVDSKQGYTPAHLSGVTDQSESHQYRDSRTINCRDGSFCFDGGHMRQEAYPMQGLLGFAATATTIKNDIEGVTETL